MIRDLGIVKPGTLLYIPFHTFDSNDPSASVTLTGLAVTDIEIYKDGSVTQRASDNGYALLDTDGIDFDGITGIHGLSIDLADNTTAGFWAAGSQYWVVISSVTVDAATINFVLCTFKIGIPGAVLNTTIATLSSQTSFTLTAGPAEDDALNGCVVYIHDVASAVQGGFAVVSDYTGSTKTVTLVAGTTFTAAATDNIAVFPPALLPTTLGRTLDVSAGGEAGVDWANVGTPGSTVGLSATTVATVTTTTTATNLTNAPTNGDLTATMKTSVQTAADAALVAENLDHLLKVAAVAGDAVDSSIVARLASKSATPSFASFVNTTDSLEAIRDKETDIETDTAEIGTAGAGLTNINLPDQTMNITGDITGNLSGSVGSVTGLTVANVDAAAKSTILVTTIASVTSQTILVLTDGSGDDNAYRYCEVVIEDVSTATQKSVGFITVYTGSTKTMTLREAPAFTVAATDKVYILANALRSATIGGGNP